MQRLARVYLVVVSIALSIGPARASDDATAVLFDFPGSVFTTARDINPAGDIVGRYGTADKRTHGYLRTAAGAFTSIDYPGANLTATIGINPGRHRRRDPASGSGTHQPPFVPAPGRRVHSVRLQRRIQHECLRNQRAGRHRRNLHGTGQDDPRLSIHRWRLHDHRFPGASETHPFKITSQGVIVGAYVDSGATNRDFVLDGAGYRTVDLPQVPVPTLDDGGINNRGDITGWFCMTSACSGAGDIYGFLLNQDGFHIVDVPGATCVFGPLAINAQGDMIGSYSTTTACTDNHAFLLTGSRRGAESEHGNR